ncbi:MAG TPA: DUF1810 domain-containing protein [Devosiaceae bacterium]|jgi:uncharacterized protein (DUF1810 family)|nr:DUF1810 domain-containing protein [Devosiaceae bacterium]
MDQFRHFVLAQEPVYGAVEAELAAGCKKSHWMWFVFPQFAGLGHSAMAEKYALHSLAEAEAYARHPVLGPRLRHCTGLVNHHEERSIGEIFGSPDDMKFHSSMTLFSRAAPDNADFLEALARFFSGRPDQRTLMLLGGESAG